MKAVFKRLKIISLIAILGSLGACGGGGDSSSTPLTPVSAELMDPTPDESEVFGSSAVILNNGNIVVTDSNNANMGLNSGAVHLYEFNSNTLIASVTGDNEDDQLGSGGITALSNNNYVVISNRDSIDGNLHVGSVRLIHGSSGTQIGPSVIGDQSGDFSSSSVTRLGNNNYVITSQFNDDGLMTDNGSVMLLNGSSGIQIGNRLQGDQALDRLGSGGITALANGNYVIASPEDDNGVISNAGSVILVDGVTGVPIITIRGERENDQFGRTGISGGITISGITALDNNNFVSAASFDDANGVPDSGSVRLINGNTVAQLRVLSIFSGNDINDNFGSSITALSNNNYVVSSPNDDNLALVLRTGSLGLFNGNDGTLIGSSFFGDQADDRVGSAGVTALTNGNYVVASPDDDNSTTVDIGSLILFDGTTGLVLGGSIGGAGAKLGAGSVTPLTNNNYVFSSSTIGTTTLINGNSAAPISATVNATASLAQGIDALNNNNFVNTGPTSTALFDGNSGDMIGDAVTSESRPSVTALSNANYVILSNKDDFNGITDAGIVRLVNGDSGEQIGSTINGTTTNDLGKASIVVPTTGNFYVLRAALWDNNGQENSGLVRIIAP